MINQNLLLTGDDGYNLTNSLRFRSSASAYLNRTQTTPTTATKWTYSYWVKRGIIGGSSVQTMVSGTGGGGSGIVFYNDKLWASSYSGGYQWNFLSAAVYRDPAAWYHIMVAYDSTQATDTNRVKIYVNGVQLTAFTTDVGATTYPSLNSVGYVGGVSGSVRIGLRDDSFYYFDGYLAEMYFVDGQQLTPSSFGETSTSTGVWIPKKYTGTYGTNGFYLPFTDNSALTTSSNVGLGKDFSGNANYWTTNNISITAGTTYDSMTDVPTLTSTTASNYCTWNPLNRRTTTHIKTASAGNLNVSGDTDNTGLIYATIYPTTGKWYFEFSPANTYANSYIGIGANNCESINSYPGNSTSSVGLEIGSGKVYKSSLQATYTGISAGEIGMIAWDCDTGKVWMGRQGTWFNSGDPAAGTGQIATLTAGENGAMVTPYSSSGVISTTFGQRPLSYTPPTGFNRLNAFNLPTPTIGATASTLANKYFNAITYTGNGGASSNTTQNITTNFYPDLTWVKGRDSSFYHRLTSTGLTQPNYLSTNSTDAEGTLNDQISALASTYFQVKAAGSGGTNQSGLLYVGWAWNANSGSTVSNTAGSITSTVSANTTAGFSVVTYTGNGANSTVGHGLGVAPSMYIVKRRSNTGNWYVYHISIGNTNRLRLDESSASTAESAAWNNTSPTSTVFSIGTSVDVNASANTYVAYCFAPVAGYSAFGSYTGNGSTDGPFIYTGFRPAFILTKDITTSSFWWEMVDSARSPFNVVDRTLYANVADAEYNNSSYNKDLLSNGFKIRNTNGGDNTSGSTYIYMAFAENPFKYANAR